MDTVTVRNFFSRLAITLAVLVTCTSFISTVDAASLPPNSFQLPVSGEADVYGATLVNTTGPTAFNTFLYSGTLTSSVYTADPTNPYGPTGLTFTYLLTNDGTSIDSLERLTVIDFSTFLTDASYQTPVPLGDTIPTAVDRSISGGTIGFFFIGPGAVAPGETSALLVLQTDSTGYVPSTASVINGEITQVATFAPVPEPSTIGAAIAGLMGLGFVVRRRIGA
jgi:hypothetical protein